MAERRAADLVAGAAVLVVAFGFLGYAVANTGRATPAGMVLHATFDRIDGLSAGSAVRIAGVDVGKVAATRIDDRTFQAVVDFAVSPNLKLPVDSSAQIMSDGLLGGKFMSLVPGGDEKTLAAGATMTVTQSAVSLEDLLGKFIFNVGELSTNVQKSLREKQPASNP